MANNITFSGIGSSIDFGVITDAIISSRSRPLVQLTVRQSDFKAQSDALKQFNSKLIALKEAADALNDRSLGSGLGASSSSPEFVTASATSGATSGTIGVEVVSLATSLAQASTSFASADSSILAGGANTATFELRKGGASTGTTITIDSTNNSLAGLRDTINAAGAGITAAIVDISGDGTQNQLVLNSSETGAAGRVELVETTSTGTGSGLDLRTLNPISGSFADLDAQVKINGLAISRSTNTITDAVSGITLNLKAVGSSNVNISSDTSSLKSKIAAFVDAFNGVQDFINSQFKLNANGKPSGVLSRDSTLRAVQQSLRDIINVTSSENGGAFTSLTQIGITRDENGKLQIDQDIINDKLKTSLADVQALFAGKADDQTGLATSLLTISTNLSSNVESAITGFDASVSAITKSIEAQQSRLDALRTSLTRQFSVADAAIGQLNGQGTALTSIIKSLEPRTNS